MNAHRLIAALLLHACAAPLSAVAAESWGGSLGVANDYLVRGISRTNHDAVLQGDLHVASDFGLIGGISAATTRFSAGDPRDVELAAFVGYAWTQNASWNYKVLASHYAYPWNNSGSQYNYDELTVEAAFRDWVTLSVMYSPNYPIPTDYGGLTPVSEKSIELNTRTPSWHRLTGTAGIGYSNYSSEDGAGFEYWSLGGAYDWAPFSVSLSYVSTTAGARYVFYDAAAHDRWTVSVIWQF